MSATGVSSAARAAPLPNGVPAELWTALQSYKANYASYKVTGQAASQTAYTNALSIANQAIANLTSRTQANDSTIQEFLASYTTTNEDVMALQTRSKAIQKQGPELQDKLAQAQQLQTHTTVVADETSLYVKSAIVFGLLVIAGIIGAV